MEGAGPDVSGALPQKGLQPGLQLAGCLVGEGNGKDLPGRHRVKGGILVSKRPVRGHLLNHLLTGSEWEPVRIGGIAVFQKIIDTVDENGGLAASCPGKNQQGPVRLEDGLLLHGV